MKKKFVVIPIFVPHKGCPFDCIYCNQKTISGQVDEMTVEKMKSVIDSHLQYLNEDSHVEIGFYGGNFTGIEKEQQLLFLKTASEYIKADKIKEIRLSTRPDYINHDILTYLKEYNVRTIELGVQSLDNDVLKLSCRGHNSEDVINACRLIKESGITLGIQTMIGLPGSSREKDVETGRKVVALAPNIVRIYPTLVIKETYLEKMYLTGKYSPLTLGEAVDVCAELLDLYENNRIHVIRIGLQPTENINEDSDVAAGPFHPAFRQLVESRLALRRMEKIIEEQDLVHAESLLIVSGKRYLSNISGQKSVNIEYLKEKYGYRNIRVKAQEGLDKEIFIKIF